MSDPRFSALSSDPRYRLPSRKAARTVVDPRFQTLFTDQEFRKKASVDRYGRKIKPKSTKKDLERLYKLDKGKKPKGKKQAQRGVVGSSDESEEEESEDEELVQKRDYAREGFSESESEEETSDEEESDSEAELAEDTAGQEQTENIPMGEVAARIACVNLDWDNIRAADIMAVARSFAPQGGSVRNVTIYPSEFGRERLEREEIEGPPREIFASSAQKDDEEEDEDESSDDDEKIKTRLLQNQASEGQEFDTAKLRQYQLERLRYYYAVITCDSPSTAKILYDAMDGREYLSTSNFFDLRFVPDETSFEDDKPHDECSHLPSGYKPNDFRTEALTHSKVRLTWDDEDATRKEVQKRAFSRAEMDENDLQAYIGSDDSDGDSISSRKSSAEDRKAKKKDAQRAKMREALGLSDSKPSKTTKDEFVGDMQITFTSGLGGGKEGKGVFENEPQDEISTRERYIKKEKERKQRRKEKMKASRKGDDQDASSAEEEATTTGGAADEDDPFNDPFFTNPSLAAANEKSARKASTKEKASARAAADAEAESRRAELELLMADEDGLKHFDERELDKARKAAKRKGKKGSKPTGPIVEDDFKIETEDPRFAGMFDSHEFAIDPTHAKFKDTDATKKLREEQRKKRKLVVEEDGVEMLLKGKKKRSEVDGGDGEDVRALAARLKSKAKKRQ